LTRHLLTGTELRRDEVLALLDRADALKAAPLSSRALEGRSIALIFEKHSTRTRLSFEAGIFELGGQPVVLRRDELHLARGESVGDTARVLSRHMAAIGVRTGPDALLEELAEAASVPVFNMLTAGHHPCQALADLMTLREEFGRLEGLKVAYVGDGNNVARSLALLGAVVGVEVAVASPAGYALSGAPGALLTAAGAITKRAQGVVRLQLEWVNRADGSIGVVERLAPIKNGRWGVKYTLPPGTAAQIDNRCSTLQSYVLFTGYQKLLMRGEMRAFQVAPAPVPVP